MANKFAVSTVFSAINKVSTVVKKITADVGGLGVVAERTKTVLGGIGKTGMAIGKGIGIAGAATGAAALGVYKLAESVSTLGDDVAKTARSLGLSTNALQEFRYIGERSGVSVDEMDVALKKLTVNVGDATSEVAKSITKLGLSPKKLKSSGPDEALNLIADGMVRIKDPAERASIAFDIFGKNGVKMVNVLSEGRTGMAALAKEANRVGYVLDGPTLDASERLNDMILNMKTSFKALGNQLASRLMPMVTKAVITITDFLVNNREKINAFANGILGLFQGIGPEAAKLIPIFMDVGKAALPILKQLLDGLVKILPSIISVAGSIGKILIPILKMLEPLLRIIIPTIEFLARILATLSEAVAGFLKPIIDGISFVLDKVPSLAKALQTAPSGAYGNATYDMAGGASAEYYGSTPVSSQTTTINRNTRNTLDVNFNNPPPGTSVRSTGPSAPPVTVRTGSMFAAAAGRGL